LENVVIGVFNLLKILLAQGDAGESQQVGGRRIRKTKELAQLQSGPVQHAVKLFLMPFFTVHYGMFCFVHGIFVVTLLGGDGPKGNLNGNMGDGFSPFGPFSEMMSKPWFVIAVIGMIASHGISFATNYIGQGEYRKYSPITLMFLPYGRIIVLHIALIFGAFLIMSLGSPLLLLVIVVVGKVWMDVTLHLVEHNKATTSKNSGQHAGESA
jgi:hypothetical protein